MVCYNAFEAYKNYEYKIENKNVYLKIRYVIVGYYDYSNFNININDDFSDIENVYITDGKNERKIWLNHN